MSGNVTSMAVALEDDVRELAAEGRLKWPNAYNTADYYIADGGVDDGVAASLEAVSEKFCSNRTESADFSFFVQQAAQELWSLRDGRGRTTGDALRIATAIQHLTSALQIEAQRRP